MAYFDTGLVVVKGVKIKVQEITINASRELTEVYSSDSKDVDEIRDGRKKVEFSIKRAIDNGRLSLMYERGCEFAMVLYNNDVQPPQKVMVLERCKLGKDNWSIDGSKAAAQDIDGKATVRKLYLDETQGAPVNTC